MTDRLHVDTSFAVMPTWLLDLDVSAQAIRLYAVLRLYADNTTGVAFPSRATLKARLHVRDIKTVDRALAELVEVGAVTVEHRRNAAGDLTSNRYVVRLLPPEGVGAYMGVPPPGGVGSDTSGGTVGAPEGQRTRPTELDPLNQRDQLPASPEHAREVHAPHEFRKMVEALRPR